MRSHQIGIKPSGVLATAVCVAHMGAGAAIWFAAVPLWARTWLTVVLGAALVWSLFGRALLRAPESIVVLEITAAGKLSFLTRGGIWHACELLVTSYVSPCLTILNLVPQSRGLVRHVVLVPDNVDARDFRRLRTWLRWAARPESQDAEAAGNHRSM